MESADLNMDDQLLVEKIKSGEHGYFKIFTSRYENFILKKCQSYVKESEVAEDLCQEVFIKVFLQLPKFRNEAKLSTWLYAIIHNTCMDYLRTARNKGHQIITQKLINELEDIISEEVEGSFSPEEIMLQLLDEISSEDKLLLLLKYKEKHSIKDISNSLQVSESAVKMRLSRAKSKIKKLIISSESKQKNQKP